MALLPPAHATGCAAPTLAQWTALTAGSSTRSAEVQLPRLHLGLMARRAGDRERAKRELGQALSATF